MHNPQLLTSLSFHVDPADFQIQCSLDLHTGCFTNWYPTFFFSFSFLIAESDLHEMKIDFQVIRSSFFSNRKCSPKEELKRTTNFGTMNGKIPTSKYEFLESLILNIISDFRFGPELGTKFKIWTQKRQN